MEFKKNYVESLKKELVRVANTGTRYVFTFGTFAPFKKGVLYDVIGNYRRCALIFDTNEKRIIYFDTLEDSVIYTDIYTFDKDNLVTTSLNLVLSHKLKELDFLTDYKFMIKNIKLQTYDVYYKNIIQASTYYRFYKNIHAKRRFMDWSGGYCGLYMLLLLVLMQFNPYIELIDIMSILTILSLNYKYIMVLIRSFAYQIEQNMYDKKPIEFQILNTRNLPNILSHPEAYPKKNILADVTFAPEIVPQNNIEILKENKDQIINKKYGRILLTSPRLMLSSIGSILVKIYKLRTKLTPEQKKWLFAHYGPDKLIYFISY